MTVFALWSAPRARSTAFFRSVAERRDVLALHEPFWNILAFGDTDVDGRTFVTAGALLAWLNETGTIEVFLKETTDHRFSDVLANQRFLAEARHAFLIRHPEEVAASYFALWPEMRMEEVGLEIMYELHAAVRNAGGYEPVVIDSDDLVARPEATMAAYCTAVDLPFIAEALTWEPGDRAEWERSAGWHVEVSASSGFKSSERAYTVTVENSDKLARSLPTTCRSTNSSTHSGSSWRCDRGPSGNDRQTVTSRPCQSGMYRVRWNGPDHGRRPPRVTTTPTRIPGTLSAPSAFALPSGRSGPERPAKRGFAPLSLVLF